MSILVGNFGGVTQAVAFPLRGVNRQGACPHFWPDTDNSSGWALSYI